MPAVRPDEDESVNGAVDEFITVDAEPAADDGTETGDRIELVRTGLIRIHVGASRFRLRRPFFGEFKRFRLQVEEMNDEIDALSQDSLELAAAIGREEEERKDLRETNPTDWRTWRMDARRRTREATRQLTDRAEELRIEWVRAVWTELSIDGVPDDLPAWVVSAQLPATLMTHWRSVPSGRG